jgi:hemolysin activation/secretion protein
MRGYMNRETCVYLHCAVASLFLSVAFPDSAQAADPLPQLPGPADVGRIKPEEQSAPPDHGQDQQMNIPSAIPSTPVPPGAESVHFVLKSLSIEGATVFTPQQLADVYMPYLGKQITLDIAYKMAAEITKRYRDAGYFLSMAYVPNQSITDGALVLRVIEGSVGKVEVKGELDDLGIMQSYIDRLVAMKPLKAADVESFLLRINDLPGYSFRAVLAPLENIEGKEGAVDLTLVPAGKEGKGTISFDNYSSRFLGPQEGLASYSASVIPWQQTTITGLTSLPEKMRYGTLDHIIPIAPDLTLEFNGSATKAYPGYTLENYDIDSLSTSGTVSLNYQWIRQRQEDLTFKLSLDARDVTSDILHTPQTRDRIRAVRVGGTYDMTDQWNGYNVITVTLSQGIDAFNASNQNDPYLSRAGAVPIFEKAELTMSRQQALPENFSLLAAAYGQLASDILYSSEQFGYGGQAFGRAYDSSVITGDEGLSASLELRYDGFGGLQPVSFQPYGFWDIGEVRNRSVIEPGSESAASAGVGLRVTTQWHESANIGVAWPLTREVATPIYGGNHYGPRFMLQIGQGF